MATQIQNDWVATVLGLDPATWGGGEGPGEGGPIGRLKALLKARRNEPADSTEELPAQQPATAPSTQAPPPSAPPAGAPPASSPPQRPVPPRPPPQRPPPPVPETPQQRAARVKTELRSKQAFSPHAEAQSTKRYAALPAADQQWFDLLVDAAGNETEKKFIRKALAAGNKVDEIATFTQEIRGKSEEWLLDNLTLTADSTGKGIQQQFVMSCQATTVQAVRGALDPVYALKLRKETGNISDVKADVTGAMAAEQKALLETTKPDGAAGGVAASLHAYNAARPRAKVAGTGRRGVDLLNGKSAATGLQYATVMIAPAERATAVTDIAGKLAQGMPVPLSVGGAEGQLAHYVLAVAFSEGPPRQFLIHDPGTGDTVQVAEADILANTMRLPSGWNFLNKYEQPSQT